MNPIAQTSHEPRPRDFSARFDRARPVPIGAVRRPKRRFRLALLLAGAVALPAFAQPGEWERFRIDPAGEAEQTVLPMPFEQAGWSFPGSAFYYLNLDEEEEPAPALGEGIRSDGAIDFPQERIDTGPAARAMRIDNSGVDRNRAIDCLTAAIYYEARSEPDSGQRAVAQVVLNRVAHPSYPSTVCGVVYQGSQRRTGCQFSFTCDGSLARKPSQMFWDRARGVALSALGGYVHAPAGLATHYHTVQIYPYWAPSLHYMSTIGAHRFYRFKGHAGQPNAFRFAYRGGEPTATILARSDVAQESASELNPAKLQEAYEEGYRRAQAQALTPASAATGEEAKPAPPPVYSEQVRERGGEALYTGEKLPEAHGIKEEYRNSGRWLKKPGS
jgi:hypothetical protein